MNTLDPTTPIAETPSRAATVSQRPLAAAAVAVAVLLVVATIGLWAHFGTAVFYETILAGVAACF